MTGHKLAMLGTGLIGHFYTLTLHGQRSATVRVVYSRSGERATAFAAEHGIPVSTTDLEEAIAHPETDAVLVGLPNHLHEEAIALCARHGKTVPLHEAAGAERRGGEADPRYGRAGGDLRRLPRGPGLHAEDAESGRGCPGRPDRSGDVGAVAGDAPRAAQRLVLGRGAGGRRRHRRPRLPLRRDHPLLRGQGNRPVDVFCWADTLVHPIEARTTRSR